MTATTTQVRELMRKHHVFPKTAQLYTNKRQNSIGNARTVKCYANLVQDPFLLINKLIQLAGKDNVKMTNREAPSIIVKCELG
jgi:hypothetical protein